MRFSQHIFARALNLAFMAAQIVDKGFERGGTPHSRVDAHGARDQGQICAKDMASKYPASA